VTLRCQGCFSCRAEKVPRTPLLSRKIIVIPFACGSRRIAAKQGEAATLMSTLIEACASLEHEPLRKTDPTFRIMLQAAPVSYLDRGAS